MPHTPGPWAAQIGFETHYGACRIYAGGRHPSDGMIAWATTQNGSTLDGNKTSNLGRQRDTGEIQANARLIAAAPMMLAALEAIVEPWSSFSDHELSLYYRPILAARAVIKAAKGK